MAEPQHHTKARLNAFTLAEVLKNFPRSIGERVRERGLKCAFTLAEVLITLGIIGVVAAMTIPTLIANYQEKSTISKVKKFYSMLSQAVLMSTTENGYPPVWNISEGITEDAANDLANYINPYLKIVKDCGTNIGWLGYSGDFKNLSNGEMANYDNNPTYYKLILADGSHVWFRGVDGHLGCGYDDAYSAVFFDINGTNSPNVIGKDIFLTCITSKGVQAHVDTTNCNYSSSGTSCLKYILQNNNMKYPATNTNTP